LIPVKPVPRRLVALAFALTGVLVPACGGSTSSNHSGASDGDATTFGAEFQGNGVQCGAIVCSGTQQCCLVYIETDAMSSNPTHACDQNCMSICADICPDAGGQTSMVHPGGMPTGGMPMGGMGDAGGMHMGGTPMSAMGDAMAAMGGTGGMPGMGGPMGGMGHGPMAPEDAGEQ
jgi:hypothetical protein